MAEAPDLRRRPDGAPQDEIIIMLPDGRIVRGHALIVQDPLVISGGGHIEQHFDLVPSYNGRVCVILMECNDFTRERITLS